MKATTKERLKFLELCLLLLGEFKKSYFHLLFDTKRAQQTKDLETYIKNECPMNIRYDDSLKRYVPTPHFDAKFLPDDASTLLAYQKYVEDLIASKGEESPFHRIEYISQPFLTAPNIELWGILNRAITKKQVLSINYSGLRKKEARYTIQSLALVHNGFRWHVRAYVVGEDRYRDFVLSRISQPQVAEMAYCNSGVLENDDNWNSTVELVFKSHPKLTPEQAKSVEEDYGMADGKKTVQCKVCNIQHLLKLTRTGLDTEQREAHLFPLILDYKSNPELTVILDRLKSKKLIKI
ncbi:WYL domain-containing protein [Colwellia sp. 12G3]|uniref:WYL domain-containing protein n=1 Tax=Colwellia sp. 12G3 TaxID=2058299 RepID=UPI0012FF2AF5|nr:WYL domain-containing protein [Colwellia sp. 12G3]